jgi:diguanylate cyclase
MQTFFTMFTIICTLIALNYFALKVTNKISDSQELFFAPLLTGAASIMMTFQPLETGFVNLDLRFVPIIMAGLRFGLRTTALSSILPILHTFAREGFDGWWGILMGIVIPAVISCCYHRKEYRLPYSNIKLPNALWISFWLFVIQSSAGLLWVKSWTWIGSSLFLWTISAGAIAVLIAMYNDQNKTWILHRQLELRANQDSLTRLPNFRSFIEIAGNMLSRRPISIFMIDIDNFKNYNDTVGHLQGDQLLREMGELLRHTVGEQDYVARYGGEEFIVICHSYDRQQVEQLAKTICDAVSIHPFANREIQPGSRISVSIGIACALKSGEDLYRLIGHADLALYTSKSSGKNQYTIYQEDAPALAHA